MKNIGCLIFKQDLEKAGFRKPALLPILRQAMTEVVWKRYEW